MTADAIASYGAAVDHLTDCHVRRLDHRIVAADVTGQEQRQDRDDRRHKIMASLVHRPPSMKSYFPRSERRTDKATTTSTANSRRKTTRQMPPTNNQLRSITRTWTTSVCVCIVSPAYSTVSMSDSRITVSPSMSPHRYKWNR